MVLQKFKIEESDNFPKIGHYKNILISGEMIIRRGHQLYIVPVVMSFEYKNNGSYLANYKKSVEGFLSTCEKMDKNYIVNDKTKIWQTPVHNDSG